jgi:pyruvate,water dikinase
MGNKWIFWLEEIGREDTKWVGSKCANLGEMSKMGIAVPPGFAVTTEAYEKFLADTGAGGEITQYLTKFPEGPKSLAEYEEIGQTIRWIIETKEIPRDLQDTVSQAYAALCQRLGIADVPVAVRSSGVAEDLPTASFAGQYETHLNVRGKEDLLDKLKRCWASLFTTRAISYRIKNNMGFWAGSISVAVQKMVNVRAAGVGFTCDPASGDPSKMMIEGSWGLGESVVSGALIPDKYIIDKYTLNIIERVTSDKEIQVVAKGQGTVEEEVPADKRLIPCLSDQDMVRIAELAKTLELHFGMPQDIEWAISADLPFPDNVFLLQTRPVVGIKAKTPSPLNRVIDEVMKDVFKL